jgi:hypothetical protein
MLRLIGRDLVVARRIVVEDNAPAATSLCSQHTSTSFRSRGEVAWWFPVVVAYLALV